MMVRAGSNLVPRALSPGFGGGAPHLQSQGKRPEDEVGLEGSPTVLGHRSRMPKRSLNVAILLLDVKRRF